MGLTSGFPGHVLFFGRAGFPKIWRFCTLKAADHKFLKVNTKHVPLAYHYAHDILTRKWYQILVPETGTRLHDTRTRFWYVFWYQFLVSMSWTLGYAMSSRHDMARLPATWRCGSSLSNSGIVYRAAGIMS